VSDSACHSKKQSLYIAVGKNNQKNPVLVLSETPAKFQEGTDMKSIITEKTVKNLAHSVKSEQKQIQSNLQNYCPSPEKTKQQIIYKMQGYGGDQSASFSLLIALLTRGMFTD